MINEKKLLSELNDLLKNEIKGYSSVDDKNEKKLNLFYNGDSITEVETFSSYFYLLKNLEELVEKYQKKKG